MSEFSPDPDAERDELASAYLDGEVTADERARVESDETLRARVDELRAIRDALAAPLPVASDAERESAIAAAVGVSNVASLDVARARRRMRIASIAAAVVLVLGAVGVLLSITGGQNQDKFQTVAGSIGSTAGDANAAQAPQANGTGGASTAAPGRASLGAFSDRSSLIAAAQAQVHRSDQFKEADSTLATPTAKAEDSPTTVASRAPSCLVPGPADSVNEIYSATAVLDGVDVQIDVFTLSDGSLVLVVTDSSSCTQVFSQPV